APRTRRAATPEQCRPSRDEGNRAGSDGLTAMPIGYITTTLIVGFVALLALRPPLPKHSSPWNLRFGLTYLINEQPFLGLYWLAAGTVPPLLAAEVRGSVAWLA